jgi:hypothetical protein
MAEKTKEQLDTELWQLYILYFKPCDVLHQHQLRLKPYFFAGGDQQIAVGVEFMTFTQHWLASLYVVAEGWREIELSDETVNAMIDRHLSDLRVFRNAVFHFQKTDTKHKRFFDVVKFNWAEELHAAIALYMQARARPPTLLKTLRAQAAYNPFMP